MRKKLLIALSAAAFAGAGFAKLPPPSDEAKAKAAEAAAKTAHGNKVAEFQLCKSQNAVAAAYVAQAKKAGKDVKPVETPACSDPGPFVYAPPPIEAAGAHSPPATAAQPPSTRATAAALPPQGTPVKK